MGKVTGFKEFKREPERRRPVAERVHDWLEVYIPWTEDESRTQAARCMDCGVPFCHNGCPLGNLIPDWNELVYTGQWRQALDRLHDTNNFPEFTGRICPAPCEPACVLSINDDSVAIEMIEKTIVERGWSEGWITPQPPTERSGKRAAVVGSGPSGLACAQQLNRAGHHVTVFERDEYVGGLLTLGIPDFKLEKDVVRRRVAQMEAEGIVFRTGVSVGDDVTAAELRDQFDAICLTGGATVPRDLPVPGRELDGVHFAMEYLTQSNRRNAGQDIDEGKNILAEGKQVVILGGGDTGADCLGTAHRQAADRIWQLELLSEPPIGRTETNAWPDWPLIMRTSSAHEEGGERDFDIMTKAFEGENGRVQRLRAVRLRWENNPQSGRHQPVELPGTEFTIDADLVLLALGFVHGNANRLLGDLGVELDSRGNAATDASMMTNVDGVFAGGDIQSGQSLVVRAIASGRATARGCDAWLSGGVSQLPAVRAYVRHPLPIVLT